MRWGLGPVFLYESLINARRKQVYAGRSLFVLFLLAGMVLVWFAKDVQPAGPGGRAPRFQQMALVGEWFFYALTGLQISLVLLAAPAAAAGSICIDRMRGTLLHVMVTDLSDVEIVLGKLGSRLAPVFGLIVCGVPVTALAALLGGIDFGALAGALVVSLSIAFFGCVLAMTVSVWATKTHDVLMAVYAVEILWLLALPIWWACTSGGWIMPPPVWFRKANPYVLVFAPYSDPASVGALDTTIFSAALVALSGALIVLTIFRLRRVVVAQAGQPGRAHGPRRDLVKRAFPSWPTPSLDPNPVFWREWSRNRPSRLARRLWGVLLLVTWALAAWGTVTTIRNGLDEGSPILTSALVIQLMFGLLMLSATAPTSLSEENARGSLDVLLTPPLSTASIVLAKWWGTYRTVLVLAILPTLLSTFMAAAETDDSPYARGMVAARPLVPLNLFDRVCTPLFCTADVLASGAVIVSLGVLLATWIRRLGRAVAMSVIAFVLSGVGWLFFVYLLLFIAISTINSMGSLGRPDDIEQWSWVMGSLLALSPLAGPFVYLSMLDPSYVSRGTWWAGLAVVLLCKVITAELLLKLTIKTFDRKLGRIPELPLPIAHRKPPRFDRDEILEV